MVRTLALLVMVLAGCSSIPGPHEAASDPDVQALVASHGTRLGTLAVAPIESITLAHDEEAKGWTPTQSPAMDAERIRGAIMSDLAASGIFERVQPVGSDALGDAWREHADFVATVAMTNLRTSYEGHRVGLWILNMANWLFWIVPSWFVATEEYSLTFDATLTLVSAESGAVIERRPIVRDGKPIRAFGQFDELDRGWQFFGWIAPSFDDKVWLGIASRLFPAAESDLAGAATRTIDEVLRRRAESNQLAVVRRKTLGLTLGVSRYQDPVALPPLPFAADDARSVHDALAARGIPAQHLVVLADSAATVSAVRTAFAEGLARARAGDATLVSFAGYGARDQDGAPFLLLSEATAAGAEGRLGFAELARLLAAVKGEKLLVLDCGLGGGSRSMGIQAAAPTADDLAVFANDPSLAVILAGGPADPALAPEHLASGLFTYHLVGALRGAGEDHEGRISASELFNYVRPRVVAESALLGEREMPRATGLDRAWVLERSLRATGGRTP
jgi:hypothetical protein